MLWLWQEAFSGIIRPLGGVEFWGPGATQHRAHAGPPIGRLLSVALLLPKSEVQPGVEPVAQDIRAGEAPSTLPLPLEMRCLCPGPPPPPQETAWRAASCCPDPVAVRGRPRESHGWGGGQAAGSWCCLRTAGRWGQWVPGWRRTAGPTQTWWGTHRASGPCVPHPLSTAHSRGRPWTWARPTALGAGAGTQPRPTTCARAPAQPRRDVDAGGPPAASAGRCRGPRVV